MLSNRSRGIRTLTADLILPFSFICQTLPIFKELGRDIPSPYPGMVLILLVFIVQNGAHLLRVGSQHTEAFPGPIKWVVNSLGVLAVYSSCQNICCVDLYYTPNRA